MKYWLEKVGGECQTTRQTFLKRTGRLNETKGVFTVAYCDVMCCY